MDTGNALWFLTLSVVSLMGLFMMSYIDKLQQILKKHNIKEDETMGFVEKVFKESFKQPWKWKKD